MFSLFNKHCLLIFTISNMLSLFKINNYNFFKNMNAILFIFGYVTFIEWDLRSFLRFTYFNFFFFKNQLKFLLYCLCIFRNILLSIIPYFLVLNIPYKINKLDKKNIKKKNKGISQIVLKNE